MKHGSRGAGKGVGGIGVIGESRDHQNKGEKGGKRRYYHRKPSPHLDRRGSGSLGHIFGICGDGG